MADFSMADQFRGLPMGDLIGGPLIAACDAQVRLANATASFIQQIGFVPPSGTTDPTNPPPFDPTTFQVRTAAFRFTRPSNVPQTLDDNGNPTGPIQTETVELDVPLLAIVKIPALSIQTVDITFDMEVRNSETVKDSTQASASVSADASLGWGPFSMRVNIQGSVSTSKENTRQTDQSAKYHVAVHAADTGMPEGLSRVLDIMNSAIAPTTITPNGASGSSGSAPPPPPPPPSGNDPVQLDHDPAADGDLYRLTRVGNAHVPAE